MLILKQKKVGGGGKLRLGKLTIIHQLRLAQGSVLSLATLFQALLEDQEEFLALTEWLLFLVQDLFPPILTSFFFLVEMSY